MAELILLGAELIAVSVLVLALYFPRHRRKDLVVAYFGVNVGVLAVASALHTSSTGAGAGLGMGLALFGVLSIIRLRSTELDQNEVAYYFSALALGLLGALGTASIWRNIGLMALILAVIAVVDNRRVLARCEQQIVVLDAAVVDRAELILRLERLLGATVHSARVQRVDLINDSTVVDVRYSARTSETTRTLATTGATR